MTTFLVKRRAKYKGEMGLFPDSEMAEEDIALFSLGSQIECENLRSEPTTQAKNYLWGLVYKAWQNTDYWINHHVAMDWFKEQIGFAMQRRDPKTKEQKLVLKSLKRINENELRLVTERVTDVIVAEILPGIDRVALRREIEEMIGGRQ